MLFNSPVNNSGASQYPLEVMGVDVAKMAAWLAQFIEQNRTSNVCMQALWTTVSANNYTNQTFQMLATNAWLLANGMLSDPSMQGKQPQEVINYATQQMAMLCGADMLFTNRQLLMTLSPQQQNEVATLRASIPQIEGYITQYKARMSQGGFQTGLQSGGFQNPFAQSDLMSTRMPSSMSNNLSNQQPSAQTNNMFSMFNAGFAATAPESMLSANKPMGAPTIDLGNRGAIQGDVNIAAPAPFVPERVAGGPKPTVQADEIHYAQIYNKEKPVEYSNHRLYYPGSNVDGNQVVGDRVDFLGILRSSQITTATRVAEDGEALPPLQEKDIVVHPVGDKELYAFGSKHAYATMQSQLFKENLHLEKQTFLLRYQDVSLVHVFPDGDIAKLSHAADSYAKLLNLDPQISFPDLAKLIREVHADTSTPLNANIARRINVLLTKAINQVAFIDMDLRDAPLRLIDSFAADYQDLEAFAKDKRGDWTTAFLANREVASAMRQLVMRCTRITHELSQEAYEQLVAGIATSKELVEKMVDHNVILQSEQKVLIGIPHTSASLGMIVKPGPNLISMEDTPELFHAIYQLMKHVARLLAKGQVDKAHGEAVAVEIMTADGAIYEILASHDLERLALVPKF